jgi:hypothetical protein
MHAFEQIFLEGVEILTLIVGILGVSFSLFLLLSPTFSRSLSNFFNRQMSVDEKIAYLDQEVNIGSVFYRYNKLFGLLLIAGSVFTLIVFYFKLDISRLANIFSVSQRHLSTTEMIFHFLSWVGKVACFFGLLTGIILFFAPAKMKQIENKLDSRIETRPVFDKLNSSNYKLDVLSKRHPLLFGSIGLIISVFIIILSILNLIR